MARDYFAEEIGGGTATMPQKDYFAEEVSSVKKPPASIRSPVVAALKSASDIIGGPFSTQYYTSRIPKFVGGRGLSHPEAMRTAEEISRPIEEANIEGILPQVVYGAVQAAPILAGAANPFMAGAGRITNLASKIPFAGKILGAPIVKSGLGFGAYEGAKAAATGQPIEPAVKGGIKSGAAFHVGGRLGATVGQPLQRLTKYGTRIGSAAGAGATAAAISPAGERVSSAIVGGAFGAKYPAQPYGHPSDSQAFIVQNYKKAIKGKKPDSPYKLKSQNNAIVDITKDITLNSPETPRTRKELFDTARSRQDAIIEQINRIVAESPGKKLVDTVKVGNMVATYARNKNIQTIAPELSTKAQTLAQAIFQRRGLTIKEAHDMMKDLNEMAKASYADPNPYRLKSVEMYRAAADSLRAELNKTVDSLVDPRYSGLKKMWGSYEHLMRDLTKASETELTATKGFLQSGYDAYLLGDAVTSLVSGQPLGAARAVLIKGGMAVQKYLNSPEKNIQRMFGESRRAFSPKTYPLDKAVIRANKMLLNKKGSAGFPQGKQGIVESSPTESLKAEARKYKTAEEFVQNKANQFHGTDVEFETFDLNKSKAFGQSKFGHWFTEGKEFAGMFGKNVKETFVDVKNPKIISKNQWDDIRGEHAKDGEWFKSWKNELIQQGYDGLKVEGKKEMLGSQPVESQPILAAFSDFQVKTKSQLTVLWHEARKGIQSK